MLQNFMLMTSKTTAFDFVTAIWHVMWQHVSANDLTPATSNCPQWQERRVWKMWSPIKIATVIPAEDRNAMFWNCLHLKQIGSCCHICLAATRVLEMKRIGLKLILRHHLCRDVKLMSSLNYVQNSVPWVKAIHLGTGMEVLKRDVIAFHVHHSPCMF